MITKFAALAALDDALTRRCNHLCDVYLASGDASAESAAVGDGDACLQRLLHGLELAAKDYNTARLALEDARNLSGGDD